MILKGILKSYSSSTHRATVQILGSLTSWLADVPVSHAIAPVDMVAGRYVAVLTPDPAKPGDSVVVALWADSIAPVAGFHALDPDAAYKHWTMYNVSSTPRTAVISSITGDVVTLTTNDAYMFFDSQMEGIVYVKIANFTQHNLYAWVKATPAANQLQVTDAADLSGWNNGDTITTAANSWTSNRVELDLSPSLGSTPVSAVFVTLQITDTGGATAQHQMFRALTGWSTFGQLTQAAGQRIDASGLITPVDNHVFVRDVATGAGTLTVLGQLVAYTD